MSIAIAIMMIIAIIALLAMLVMTAYEIGKQDGRLEELDYIEGVFKGGR